MPHDLGVLDHYDAVLWYLGDNRLTQDPEDELTGRRSGTSRTSAVAERQQYLTCAVRDYLNEGGKLVHAGETAQYEGLPGISDAVGGLYYGLNGDETAECDPSRRPSGFFDDCLILADDFRQYYLGGVHADRLRRPRVASPASPIRSRASRRVRRPGAPDNPLDEAGVFQPTSEVLPPDEFPQFTSWGSAEYQPSRAQPVRAGRGRRGTPARSMRTPRTCG